MLLRILVFGLLLGVLGGCSGTARNVSDQPVDKMAVTEAMTWLPVQDTRQFLRHDQIPDLYAGTPIQVDTDQIVTRGRQTWHSLGFDAHLQPYSGQLPPGVKLEWRDFPWRQLATDLGMELEIKKLQIKKSGPNALIAPQALLDAALLPLFAVGVVASKGHTDLAGSILPSNRIKTVSETEVHIVSRKGGGLIWRKAYIAQQTEHLVSDNRVHDGIWPSPSDGQELGKELWPAVIDRTFQAIAYDSDLALLPRLAQTAWLDRLLAAEGVSSKTKLLWVERLTTGLIPPREISNKNEPNTNSGNDDPDGTVSPPANPASVLALANQVCLKAAGRLAGIKMVRPLTPDEKKLDQALWSKLSAWSKSRSGNDLLRRALQADHHPLTEKRVAMTILAGDLETLDNDDYIRHRLSIYNKNLGVNTPRSQEAASAVIAAKGEKAMSDHNIPRWQLFSALSGDDIWAGPLVMAAIHGGDFGPETIRLAGAMGLDAIIPELLTILEVSLTKPHLAGEMDQTPRIPLLPASSPTIKFESGPDPVLITRALAAFPNRPDVLIVLRNIVKRWPRESGFSEELVAEAISTLGRLGDHASQELIYDQWVDQWQRPRAPLVRQAALTALGLLNDSETWAKLESTARAVDAQGPDRTAALTELVEAMGKARCQSAGSWLARLAATPTAPVSVRQAAMAALSRLATKEGEATLRALCQDREPALARAAEKSLDNLMTEKAFWQELERS